MVTGLLNIGDKARWKFLKIWLICSDKISKNLPKCSDSIRHLPTNNRIYLDGSIRPQKQPNLFRLTNQASKTTHFAQISFKIANLMTLKCKYITTNLIPCIHPISNMCHATGFLASCYNGFYHPQNILKFGLQLTKELNLCVIEGEHLSILTDCWYHSQHAKESVRWKQGICSHMQHSISLMDSSEILMVCVFICLHDNIWDNTSIGAIKHPGMHTAFATTLRVHRQYYLNYVSI